MAAVVAVCGPNPAPLVELLWRLASEGRGVRAWVVFESERSRHYWSGEGRAALAELQHVLAERAPDVTLVEGEALPPHELDERVVPHLREALWDAARRAEASGAPVVFALTGGRRRASTALVAAVFQLRARPGDRLVDVRVDQPAAESGSGFFFPAQARQVLVGRWRHERVTFTAASVGIVLEDLDLPRLRPLLAPADLASFDAAQAASRRALAVASVPEVVVDVATGEIRADGRPLRLTGNLRVLYALLAVAASEGQPRVWAQDEARIRALAKGIAGRGADVTALATDRLRQDSWLRRLGDGTLTGPLPTKDWSLLAAAVERQVEEEGLPARLVPRRTNEGRSYAWELGLPPDRVVIRR